MNFNKKAVNIETVSSEMNNFGLNIIDKENYMTGETKLKMIDNFGYMYLISPYSVRGAIKRNNFIRRGSSTTYGMWCDKNGFPWCVGESVPKEWLKDAIQK